MIGRNRLNHRFGRYGLLIGSVIVLGVLVSPILASASSQNFNVLDSNTQTGMLMSLTTNPGVVAPASDKSSSSLIGVLSTNDTAFDKQPGQVSVQTDGAATALVSTLNGNILVGDRITTSTLVGVGAKASSNCWIVGIAQASLDSRTTGVITSNVTDSMGKQHKVYVARIPIVVKVTYYNVSAGSTSSIVPNSVQSAADSIAGKHANALAIILSFLLLSTGVILAGVLVNSAVRGGLAAIARQPLSKKIITRGMIQSFGLSLAILIAVIVGVLGILRIF